MNPVLLDNESYINSFSIFHLALMIWEANVPCKLNFPVDFWLVEGVAVLILFKKLMAFGLFWSWLMCYVQKEIRKYWLLVPFPTALSFCWKLLKEAKITWLSGFLSFIISWESLHFRWWKKKFWVYRDAVFCLLFWQVEVVWFPLG